MIKWMLSLIFSPYFPLIFPVPYFPLISPRQNLRLTVRRLHPCLPL